MTPPPPYSTRDQQCTSVCLSVAGAIAIYESAQDEPTSSHAARTTAPATGCSNDANNLPILCPPCPITHLSLSLVSPSGDRNASLSPPRHQKRGAPLSFRPQPPISRPTTRSANADSTTGHLASSTQSPSPVIQGTKPNRSRGDLSPPAGLGLIPPTEKEEGSLEHQQPTPSVPLRHLPHGRLWKHWNFRSTTTSGGASDLGCIESTTILETLHTDLTNLCAH